MMKVDVKPDCENAPKKALVRDWLIALASSTPDEVTGLLDPDVRWEHVGNEAWTGIDEVQARLPVEPAESLQISKLLSHGKEVAAEGRIVLGDGSKERFAHLLQFTCHGKKAKLESITTYSITTLD
jgi:ketosteroid isomerase-like protein